MVQLGEKSRFCPSFLQYYPADGPMRQVRLDPLPFRIGRGKECHLIIPSQQVSKVHAEIVFADNRFQLRDLGSTNGTFVNGRPVSKTALEHSDILHLAQEEFRFIAPALDAPPSVSDAIMTKQMQGNVPSSIFVGGECLRELIAHKRARILYQPIVSLQTREALGFEALARGTHTDLSARPAEMFMLAERCGLATALSQMLRQEAVKESRWLPGSGLLFLNLHPTEMTDKELIGTLAFLQSTRPANWEFVAEINENAVADLTAWKKLRAQLKDLDIQVAYDDFGNGQARFIELAELPPEFIKLDMRLVRNIHLTQSRQEIVQAL